MEKYITNERTGPKYELVGNYYLIAGDDEPDEEQKPIGIWGKRHHEYQNVKTTPSSVYEWGLDHGGRNGTDTMALVIGPKQSVDPSKPSNCCYQNQQHVQPLQRIIRLLLITF